MELKFIGTGSGKTSLKRHHTSILIRTQNHSLLIDSGDGTSAALLKQQIPFNEIDTILITHHHADHYSGIASLITQMKLNHRESSLSIYTHAALAGSLENFLNMCYIFNETAGFVINIVGYNNSEEYLLDDNLSFMSLQNSHVTNKHNLADYNNVYFVSCSLFITIDNKTIYYTSDIGSENDLYLFKEKRIDYFISETTHVSPVQIYKAYKEISADNLYFTHIEDELEASLCSWHESIPEAEKIFITQDGLTIKL